MNDLEKLKKAFETSTPGEWGVVRNNVLSDNYFVAEVLVEGDIKAMKNERLSNAEFMVLAHNMMPEILADIERSQVLSNELHSAEHLIIQLKAELQSSRKTKQTLQRELKQMEKHSSFFLCGLTS